MNEWLFEWRQIEWLWALLGMIVFYWLQKADAQDHLEQFADRKLWPWLLVKQQVAKKGVRATHWLMLSFAALVIALAGPRMFSENETSQNRAGVDVLVAMDLSGSMLAPLAENGGTSRYEQANIIAQSLLNTLKPQDRVGLMAFAGSAHIVSPLVYDRALFTQELQRLQVNSLPLKGSWLERAMAVGMQHLFAVSLAPERPKILLMLSDGAEPFLAPVELPEELKVLPLEQWLNDTSVHVLMVGVGSEQAVMVPKSTDSAEPIRSGGLPVFSALEAQSLRDWAHNARDGFYVQGASDGRVIEQLAEKIESSRQLQTVQVSELQWQDYSLHGVLVALIALIMAFYAPQQRIGQYSLLLAGLFVLMSLSPSQVYAQDAFAQHQAAYESFKQGDYQQALSEYESLAQQRPYQAWMGAGASSYKAENYPAAIGYYQQAAWQADNDESRARALFNLGNSYYFSGNAAFAVQAYEQALTYLNPYPDAAHNLEIAKKRREQESKMKAPADGDDADGESNQRGNDQEGAFYGGQKPESKSEEQGFGADGDAPEGNRSGEEPPEPEIMQLTQYQNRALQVRKPNSAALGFDVGASGISAQEMEQAKRFAKEVGKLEAQQTRLLKRLFEAEAGFYAEQKEPHAIQGVQPW